MKVNLDADNNGNLPAYLVLSVSDIERLNRLANRKRAAAKQRGVKNPSNECLRISTEVSSAAALRSSNGEYQISSFEVNLSIRHQLGS